MSDRIKKIITISVSSVVVVFFGIFFYSMYLNAVIEKNFTIRVGNSKAPEPVEKPQPEKPLPLILPTPKENSSDHRIDSLEKRLTRLMSQNKVGQGQKDVSPDINKLKGEMAEMVKSLVKAKANIDSLSNLRQAISPSNNNNNTIAEARVAKLEADLKSVSRKVDQGLIQNKGSIEECHRRLLVMELKVASVQADGRIRLSPSDSALISRSDSTARASGLN